MFRFIFTDENGKTYDTTNYGGIDTTIPAATTDGAAASVTWMYSYLWPLQGFYGTMYLPWSLSNGGTAQNPTQAPAAITKVRIQHNSSYTTARREMLAHFFTLTDATVVQTDEIEEMGDVPTFASLGSEGLANYISFKGMFISPDCPDEVKAWYDDICNKVCNDQEWLDFLALQGGTPTYMGMDEFTEYYHQYIEDAAAIFAEVDVSQ